MRAPSSHVYTTIADSGQLSKLCSPLPIVPPAVEPIWNQQRVNASPARMRGSSGRLTLLSLLAASSDALSNVGRRDTTACAAIISLLRIDIADLPSTHMP